MEVEVLEVVVVQEDIELPQVSELQHKFILLQLELEELEQLLMQVKVVIQYSLP